MVGFKAPSQEKLRSEILRFGYRKAANDKKVPDRVGSDARPQLNGEEMCFS